MKISSHLALPTVKSHGTYWKAPTHGGAWKPITAIECQGARKCWFDGCLQGFCLSSWLAAAQTCVFLHTQEASLSLINIGSAWHAVVGKRGHPTTTSPVFRRADAGRHASLTCAIFFPIPAPSSIHPRIFLVRPSLDNTHFSSRTHFSLHVSLPHHFLLQRLFYTSRTSLLARTSLYTFSLPHHSSSSAFFLDLVYIRLS